MQEELEIQELNENGNIKENEIFKQRSLETSNNAIQQETQIDKESSEIIYKLPDNGTETLITGEIKQLILTEVSEATSTKALTDRSHDLEKQIRDLTSKHVLLLNENEHLKVKVEKDKNIISDSMIKTLMQTNEMIEFLKEKAEKLDKQLKESSIKDILDECIKQKEIMESLKYLYDSKFKTENMSKSPDINKGLTENLKAELKRKKEMVERLKNNISELQKQTLLYDEEIEENLKRKEILEQQKIEKKKKRILRNEIYENIIIKQNSMLEKLKEKREIRCADFNQRKLKLEEQIEKVEIETNLILANVKQETLEKEAHLLELQRHHAELKKQHEEHIQKLKCDYDNVCKRRKEIETIITSCLQDQTQQINMLDKLKEEYVKKCEERVEWTNNILKKQSEVHHLDMKLLQVKTENSIKRVKFEELQSEYDASVVSFMHIDNEMAKYREKCTKELADITTKYEQLKMEHDKYLCEMKKKKEYALTNNECLKKKLENAQQEITKFENLLKITSEQNTTLKLTVEKKQNLTNEAKLKLETMKLDNNSKIVTKSILKSPVTTSRKVHFNEIPSVKSTTESSQNSSQQASASRNLLDTSFQEWLEEDLESE